MLIFKDEPKLEDYGLSIDVYEEYKKKLTEYENQIESSQISYWLYYFIWFLVFIFFTGSWNNFFLYIIIAFWSLSVVEIISESFNFNLDFLENIITFGKHNKLKKLKKEKEKFKSDFYKKVNVFENDLKNYYQNFLEIFFEENLYRKKSGNEKFEKNINFFADIIKECENVNKFLVTQGVLLHYYKQYLKDRQQNHNFNKLKKTSIKRKSFLKLHQKIQDIKTEVKNIAVIPPEKRYFTIKKIDWEKINKSKMKIGKIGEEIALEMERKYLLEIGRKDLADKICHVSAEKGDGAGYDILSFFENGKEKYIEVKSTKNYYRSFFNVSRNELNFLRNHSDNTFIYQVSEVESDEPKLKIISAREILNSNQIIPTQFIIKYN